MAPSGEQSSAERQHASGARRQRGQSVSPEVGRHWLESAGGWLAVAIALVITLWRVSESAQWRDDMAVVRGLGLVPIGGECVVSTVLTQVFALVPLGGRLMRAGMVSAVGVAATAGLLFETTRQVLKQNAPTRAFGAALSFAAALMATLSPSWQLEGTIAGGASVAVALSLATLLVRPTLKSSDTRVWLGLGCLVGLTFIESHVAGLLGLGALGAQLLVLRELPPRRGVGFFAGGASVVVGFGALLTMLRPSAQRAWVDLGYDLVGLGLAATDVAAARPVALVAWTGELGVVSLVLAAVATVWGLVRERTRWVVAPLVVIVVADTVFPATQRGLLAADPLASIRLLALAAMAIAVALGVHTVSLGLQSAKLPFSRPAAVLLVVFHFTLMLVTVEDSSHAANRRHQYATDTWTDEALGTLPPRSLVLVRSEAIAWRLWAARVVRGERPDVVVVPVHLLSRGSVARRLLELEPALADLVRDVAITGRPSEYSLSTLSDIRPLYVELDPSWDRRLHEHLVPGTLWLRFSPHALGRSDRRLAVEPGFDSFERVRKAACANVPRHEATVAVLQLRAHDQALVFAALGDRENLDQTVNVLNELDPNDPLVGRLRHRMAERKRGRVDIAGLLP